MKSISSVVILGARGSVPVSGGEFARYGQGTTCLLVRLAGQNMVLDAGTGMLKLAEFLEPEERKFTLLLTHAHADHLLGFGLCPLLLRRDVQVQIYGRTRNGQTVEQQLERLYAPPLWPVRPCQLPAELSFHQLEDNLQLGPVAVRSMEGSHPNGVSLLRLSGGGRTVVLMTDCTLNAAARPAYLDFARDCDLLLIDGQYSREEWPAHAGFGHSTWEQAAEFGRDCGARRVRIMHHDPSHTDVQLAHAEAALAAQYPQCSFACAGEEIEL